MATNPIALRLVVSKPVRTASREPFWEPMEPGEELHGIGCVRMEGYAAPKSTTSKRFKTKYTSGASLDHPWYWSHSPFLPAGVWTEVSDVVQDIDPSTDDHKFGFQNLSGIATVFPFTALDLPTASLGMKSHRLRAEHYIPNENLELEIGPYANPDAKFRCGDGRTAARLKVQAFATAEVSGIYHFHVHQEMENVLGPDQSDSPLDTRSWEMGMDSFWLPAGKRTLIGTGAASNTTPIRHPDDSLTKRPARRHTWHFAQQTTPDQPKNEIFCSSDLHDHHEHQH